MSQRSQNIHLGESQRRLTNAFGLGRDCGAQLGEEPALDFDDLLLRVENLGLILFQLRSGEALGAYQSLLAFIILRNQVQIRLRDLKVIAEDGVELYLKRSNAGPPPLPLLDLGQHLLAVARELAQLVQIAIYASGDYAAVGEA